MTKSTEAEYEVLERATVNLNQLTNFSSSHTHPFSAISEIVDNAYDADSQNLSIDILDKGGVLPSIRFTDNGIGMSRYDARNIISLGKSEKNTHSRIGRYGSGLKTGAFHLGDNLMILTKKEGIFTVLMISKDFQKSIQHTESVIVPFPSFHLDWTPYMPTVQLQRRYPTEMEIIRQWAIPGRETSIEDLKALSKGIEGPTGTIVIVGKLKRHTNGKTILNFSCEGDIEMEGDDLRQIDSSLQSRLSRLYLNPKMTIFIDGKRVMPVKICENWIGREKYEFNQGKGKEAKSKARIKKAEIDNMHKDIDNLSNEILELKGRKNQKKKIKLQEKVKKFINRCNAAQKDYDIFDERISEKFLLNCGIEIKNRMDNGLHLYLNGRLIKWGHKDFAPFKNKNSVARFGVSAYINLKSATFSPLINKEGFADKDQLVRLLANCRVHLEMYIESIEKFWIPFHMSRNHRRIPEGGDVWSLFWETYGYRSPLEAKCRRQKWDERVKRVVRRCCGSWTICVRCRRWIRASNHIPGEHDTCNTVIGEECGLNKSDDELFNEIFLVNEELKVKPSRQMAEKDQPEENNPKDGYFDQDPSGQGPSNQLDRSSQGSTSPQAMVPMDELFDWEPTEARSPSYGRLDNEGEPLDEDNLSHGNYGDDLGERRLSQSSNPEEDNFWNGTSPQEGSSSFLRQSTDAHTPTTAMRQSRSPSPEDPGDYSNEISPRASREGSGLRTSPSPRRSRQFSKQSTPSPAKRVSDVIQSRRARRSSSGLMRQLSRSPSQSTAPFSSRRSGPSLTNIQILSRSPSPDQTSRLATPLSSRRSESTTSSVTPPGQGPSSLRPSTAPSPGPAPAPASPVTSSVRRHSNRSDSPDTFSTPIQPGQSSSRQALSPSSSRSPSPSQPTTSTAPSFSRRSGQPISRSPSFNSPSTSRQSTSRSNSPDNFLAAQGQSSSTSKPSSSSSSRLASRSGQSSSTTIRNSQRSAQPSTFRRPGPSSSSKKRATQTVPSAPRKKVKLPTNHEPTIEEQFNQLLHLLGKPPLDPNRTEGVDWTDVLKTERKAAELTGQCQSSDKSANYVLEYLDAEIEMSIEVPSHGRNGIPKLLKVAKTIEEEKKKKRKKKK